MLRTDPSVKNLPLVLVITNEKTEAHKELIAQGVTTVITKPLDLSLLYGVLSSLSGQQRHTARIRARFSVEIREGLPEKKLICLNLSEGGMYLRTHKPLPEKTVIHIRFTLPHNTYVIEQASEVVRAIPLGKQIDSEPGMGLRFLNMPEAVKAKIRNYVQWEMMGDLEWETEI